jgi:hypothetical protein
MPAARERRRPQVQRKQLAAARKFDRLVALRSLLECRLLECRLLQCRLLQCRLLQCRLLECPAGRPSGALIGAPN